LTQDCNVQTLKSKLEQVFVFQTFNHVSPVVWGRCCGNDTLQVCKSKKVISRLWP